MYRVFDCVRVGFNLEIDQATKYILPQKYYSIMNFQCNHGLSL